MNQIVIVDDHAVVLHGLTTALVNHGFSVTASVSTLSQARSAIAAMVPDAVVLDINLPDGTGFDLVKWIRKFNRQLPIVILSLNDSPEYVNAARRCGANAYVVKSAPMEEILATIDFALRTPGSFSSKVRPSKYEVALTAREIDVLSLIEKGFSNAQICEQLHISLSTVKTHVSAIFQKLSVDNRVGAVKAARENGLLT